MDGDLTATVGGATAATSSAATISPAAYVAWLGQLSPAAKTAVLSDQLVEDGMQSIPPAYFDQALEIAPSAARLASDARIMAQADQLVPPLVETPDGAVYYTGGGATYRKVPDNATAASLGLNPSGIVRVSELQLKTSQPWPHAATAEQAFTETGRLIAASGDVAAAWRLGRFARARLG